MPQSRLEYSRTQYNNIEMEVREACACSARPTAESQSGPTKNTVISTIRPLVETDAGQNQFIRVECGTAKGELYLEKVGKASDGKTLLKCVKYDGDFISPLEFESVGRNMSKEWKRIN